MIGAERRVAIVLGDNFDADIFHGTKDCLNSAGITVVVGAVRKDIELIDNKGNELIRPEISIENIPDFNFDAVILSDGSVHDDLRDSKEFQDLIRYEHDIGMILGAIGLSVRYFMDAGVLKNHFVTGSPEIISEIETHGGQYENEPVWVDGNLITGRMLEDLSAFCKVLVDEIKLRPAA